MTSLIHTCGCGASHAANQLQGGNADHSTANKVKMIDLHCHVMSPEVEQIVGPEHGKKNEMAEAFVGLGEQSMQANFKLSSQWLPKLTQVEERLKDMDLMGVDIQALSPSPTQYYYWAEPQLAAKIVKIQNDEIASLCQAHPDRFVGMGNVSIQHPELALVQMRHAVNELGLKGFEISSVVNEQDIAVPEFDYFWQEVEALDCMVFLHPLGTSLGSRLDSHYLSNIIGQPLETTVALSKMIFTGVFDRFPGLRLCAAHGGGYLPFYCGRSDHGFAVRPEAGVNQKTPSEYLNQIYFDSVVYDSKSLQTLIDNVGIEQVVLGTDYPFDMGCYDLTGLVSGVELFDQERQLLCYKNAQRLLKI